MKNIVILILCAVVVWFAWRHHTREPITITRVETRVVTQVETNTTHIVAAEKYGQSLRSMTDRVFCPLDTQTPNPVAEAAKLAATAETDLRNGIITGPEADIIARLCAELQRLNVERERYETEYRGILTRRYDSFGRGTGTEGKCQRAVKTSHGWALENQPL